MDDLDATGRICDHDHDVPTPQAFDFTSMNPTDHDRDASPELVVPVPIPAGTQADDIPPMPRTPSPRTPPLAGPSATILRDHLLHALSTHPGTRTWHLHVLVTAPRKSGALFPFAIGKDNKAVRRVYLQDVLVLVSEEKPELIGLEPPGGGTSSMASDDDPQTPRIIVTAIEASIYTLPLTSTAILYISKVDSSGHASSPSPTSLLVRSLITFYTSPSTRASALSSGGAIRHIWVQLFARAQAQYLFANSAEWVGKRPLGDRALCAWWRRCLGRVGRDLKSGGEVGVKMYYILPGYLQMEAEHALRIAGHGDPDEEWIYGHPYNDTTTPLPCPYDPTNEDSVKNLGRFIPYFDDDPKSRFLDEIAYTTDGDLKSPQRKRARTVGGREDRDGDGEKDKDKDKDKDKADDENKPPGEMGKVTADEFWERMSFRQECVAGAVTGFFTLVVSCPPSLSSASPSTRSPLEPMPGQVGAQVNKRVMTTLLTGVEFSTVERAVKATETVEGAIRGLCEGIVSAAAGQSSSGSGSGNGAASALLLQPPRTPPRGRKHPHIPEVSPNPFAEPVASLETYRGYIYGSVATRNAVVPVQEKKADLVGIGGSGGGVKGAGEGQGEKEQGRGPTVNVLQVRRKKKKV